MAFLGSPGKGTDPESKQALKANRPESKVQTSEGPISQTGSPGAETAPPESVPVTGCRLGLTAARNHLGLVKCKCGLFQMLIGMHRGPPKGNQEMGPVGPGAVGRGEQGQAAQTGSAARGRRMGSVHSGPLEGLGYRQESRGDSDKVSGRKPSGRGVHLQSHPR